MSDKRYLFRGFHPDEQGDATIVVNGEKVKGEWIYGYYLYSNKTKEHYIVSNESNEFVIPELEYFQSILKVIPETVGQWVTTDKNGKDVFEGDLATVVTCFGDIFVGYVWYDDIAMRYWVKNDDMEQQVDFTYLKTIERDISKWECEV